jgi:hypothetical protein
MGVTHHDPLASLTRHLPPPPAEFTVACPRCEQTAAAPCQDPAGPCPVRRIAQDQHDARALPQEPVDGPPALVDLLARHVQRRCYTTPDQHRRGLSPDPACWCPTPVDCQRATGTILAEYARRLGYNWRL